MATDIEKKDKHWNSVSIGNLFLKMGAAVSSRTLVPLRLHGVSC